MAPPEPPPQEASISNLPANLTYYTVGQDTSRLWFAGGSTYVPATDPGYLGFVSLGGVASASPDEATLTTALAAWNATGPAPRTPSMFPLSDLQLRLGLIAAGKSVETIEAQIKSITDPVQRQTFWAYWDRATTVRWDSTEMQALLAFVGIPVADAAVMWMAAVNIKLA